MKYPHCQTALQKEVQGMYNPSPRPLPPSLWECLLLPPTLSFMGFSLHLFLVHFHLRARAFSSSESGSPSLKGPIAERSLLLPMRHHSAVQSSLGSFRERPVLTGPGYPGMPSVARCLGWDRNAWKNKPWELGDLVWIWDGWLKRSHELPKACFFRYDSRALETKA